MISRRGYLAAMTIPTLSGCTNTLESIDGNREEKEDILNNYEEGVRTLNSAGDQFDNGTERFNNEQYQNAERIFGSAETSYQDAASDFSDASNIAVGINHDEAEEICDDAREFSTLLSEASFYLKQAAEKSQGLLSGSAEEDLNRARNLISEARRINVRDVSTLQSVLGLD